LAYEDQLHFLYSKLNKGVLVLKVACDIDGVLANFIPHLREGIYEHCGYDILGKVKIYDFHKNIPGLEPEDWRNIVDSILSCQDDIQSYDGSEWFPILTDTHNTILITARRSEFNPETQAWLKKNLKIISPIVNKSSKDKVPYLVNRGFDVLIEDRFSTANEAAKHMQVFLVNRPWNTGRVSHKNVVRVRSFREVAKILCK
jgi:uncharacterized HAD superfamily protein